VRCRYNSTHRDTGVTSDSGADLIQSGTCASPYVYDSAVYMCTTCPVTQSQPIELKGPESPVISSNGSAYVLWSPDSSSEYCSESCKYTGASTTACYRSPGSPDKGYCNFMVAGTGSACDSPNAPLAV